MAVQNVICDVVIRILNQFYFHLRILVSHFQIRRIILVHIHLVIQINGALLIGSNPEHLHLLLLEMLIHIMLLCLQCFISEFQKIDFEKALLLRRLFLACSSSCIFCIQQLESFWYFAAIDQIILIIGYPCQKFKCEPEFSHFQKFVVIVIGSLCILHALIIVHDLSMRNFQPCRLLWSRLARPWSRWEWVVTALIIEHRMITIPEITELFLTVGLEATPTMRIGYLFYVIQTSEAFLAIDCGRKRLDSGNILDRLCLLDHLDFTPAFQDTVFELDVHNVFDLEDLVVAINELEWTWVPMWYGKGEREFVLSTLHWVVLKLLSCLLRPLQRWSKLKQLWLFSEQWEVAIFGVITIWTLFFWVSFFFVFQIVLNLWFGRRLLLFCHLWAPWDISAADIALSWLVDRKKVQLAWPRLLLNILLRDWWWNSAQEIVVKLSCV